MKTIETIGNIIDKINSLKVSLEDELNMLDCCSDEYEILAEYICRIDLAESELSETGIELPNCNWLN